MFASDVNKSNSIEQRVTAKAVVTKDGSRQHARSVETSNCLATRTTYAGVKSLGHDGATLAPGMVCAACLSNAAQTKDVSRKCARSVETSNGLAIRIIDTGAQAEHEATHAMMNFCWTMAT